MVGIVLQIVGHDRRDDLGFILEAFGEKRPNRAVYQTADQRFLFARPAFTLEKATRDLAGGIGLFLVIDGQGEEIEARLGIAVGDRSRQNRRFAIGHQHGTVGLAGDFAALQGQRAAAPFQFHFMMIKHESPFCQ